MGAFGWRNGKAILVLPPSFYHIIAVFCFPGFQDFMIAAFGLNNFSREGVLVGFNDASPALALLRLATADGRAIRAWIENGNNITQTLSILAKKDLEVFFELDFFLKASVIFERLEMGKLLSQGFLRCSKFSEFRHVRFL